VVTERTQIVMPEAAIGNVPDVGSTHLLAQTPGNWAPTRR
jgi:enoyl-CoA hydratase